METTVGITKNTLKTPELMSRLMTKFAPPAYAFFKEVADGAGFQITRHIDGLAISLWPSRGLTITGFELKASRSDWTKELKNPAKAEAVARYCDYFYLVVGDRNIVKTGELPDGWGLIVPGGNGLKIEKEAPKTIAADIDRFFLAAVARRASEAIGQLADAQAKVRDYDQKLRAEYERGVQTGKASVNGRSLLAELDDLKARVAAFEECSGLKVDRWDKSWPESTAKAIQTVRLLSKGEVYGSSISNAIRDLQILNDAIQAAGRCE